MSSDMTQIMEESTGTLTLVLFGDGVYATVNLSKSKAQASGWIVIAFGRGLVVATTIYIPGFMDPVHLNPTVSLAMAMAGAISWNSVVPFITAQASGTLAGVILVWLSHLPYWSTTRDEGTALGTFATGPVIRSYSANVITELIGTFVLVLGLLTFGQNESAPGTNVFAVGRSILAVSLSSGGPIGYAISPARNFDPRLAHTVLPIANKETLDWAYSWVPVAGPMTGVIITIGVYSLMV